ncbi:MAG: hypothetical protein FJW86_12405 [Actinobacteria bacterium]|nr:hypothetical protein [Actinomycetota bacterium]
MVRHTVTAIVLASVTLLGLGGAAVSAPLAKEIVVKRIELTLVDESRPTPANGTFAGTPDRTLETVVSMPKGASKKKPLPLIVFATGIGGTATNYADMYDHWVRAGYIVAAPTFPLSSEDAPGGTSAVDLTEQPADLSFVLDEVLRLNDEKGSGLTGLIDADRIGLAGKSLGAVTVIDLFFKAESHDDRFKALLVLTGIGRGDFAAYPIPILLVHGDADEIVPVSGSVDIYTAAQPPKHFVTVYGASHSSAFHGEDDPASSVVVQTAIDFFDLYLKGKKAALARLERDGNVADVAAIDSTTP